MFLQSASIHNFRSIEKLYLNGCRSLNVLIGKNNAGKSNILTAIHTVFACAKSGNVVAPHPHVSKDLNFFSKNTQDPILITLHFSLSRDERDTLLREIAAEVPHMKNAVDGLDASLWLTITVTVVRDAYAIFSKIALSHSDGDGKAEPVPERLLLEIGESAARELNAKASRISQLLTDVRTLRAAAERLPALMRRSGSERDSPPASYILRYAGIDVSPESAAKVEALVRNSSESEDLPAAIRTLSSDLQREASELQREPIQNKLKTLSGEETSVPRYVTNLIEQIGSLSVLHFEDRRKPIGKEEAQRLLELKMSRGGPQVLKRIQDTVAALLGVQIDAFRGDSQSVRSEAEAELDVDNFLVQVNGSGIREALRLILDSEFGKPTLCLIEEPEMHLHPALEASIMRYLQNLSTTCQVFLTTHSTNFLDSAGLTNVYLVSKGESTTVQLLDLQEAETILPSELGLRMSSLFMYDRLVFVEGPSDEGVLREWASILNVNLSQSSVGFVRMGGARNFSHYAAAATLSFLAKRRVKCWILLDRDERDEAEIERFEKIAGNLAKVIVLDQREIENLLLVPRTIVEFIKEKIAMSSSAIKSDNKIPTEELIRVALEDAFEKLKSVAAEKRITKTLCTPLFPPKEIHDVHEGEAVEEKIRVEMDRLQSHLDNVRGRIEEVCKAKRAEIAANWGEQKSRLVPGELALDAVFGQFGLRFNKDHDAARLAALMHAGEIDPAMRALLEELGQN
jgi:predicted ATP-dependent endonuclease of OLD family